MSLQNYTFDENGQLVAVAVAGMSKEVTEGISFGIKSSAVTNFLKTNKIPSDRLIPLFMTNLESIDINDKFDYEVALNFSKKIIYK